MKNPEQNSKVANIDVVRLTDRMVLLALTDTEFSLGIIDCVSIFILVRQITKNKLSNPMNSIALSKSLDIVVFPSAGQALRAATDLIENWLNEPGVNGKPKSRVVLKPEDVTAIAIDDDTVPLRNLDGTDIVNEQEEQANRDQFNRFKEVGNYVSLAVLMSAVRLIARSKKNN